MRWLAIVILIILIVLRGLLIYRTFVKLASGTSVKIIRTIKNGVINDKGNNYVDADAVWIRIPKKMALAEGDRIEVIGKLGPQVTIKNSTKFLLIPGRIYKKENKINYSIKLKEKLLFWIPGDEGALAVGLLFGGTGYMSREMADYFRRAGISHILAASGYNVSLVAGWITAFCVMAVGRRKGAGLSIAGIWVYVWLAGPSAAVVRAAVMGTAAVIGLWMGRETDVGWWLVLSALLMLVYNPLWILDVGFLLSFAAMGGILFISPSSIPPLNLRGGKEKGGDIGGLFGFFKETLKTTLAAQVATMPIILHFFGNISVIAPIANLAILWLIPVSMQILAVGMVFGPVLYLAWPPLHFMIWITRVLGSLDIASFEVGKIGWMWVGAYYATLLLIFNFKFKILNLIKTHIK